MNQNQNQNCETCRLKTASTQRGGLGKKLTLSFQNQIKLLKLPRNLDTPPLNIYQFIKSHHNRGKTALQLSEPPRIESRLQTHNTKTRTEHQEILSHKSDDSTARIDFTATQPMSKLPSTSQIKSSAFYKMRLMRTQSREKLNKPKSLKLQIGPIFNQVSKYVHTSRPNTVKAQYSDIFKPTNELEDFHRAKLTASKSEFLFKPPVSPKLCEVQQLLKNKL